MRKTGLVCAHLTGLNYGLKRIIRFYSLIRFLSV